MWNKNIETFIGCDSEYQDADAVIFGAPFDSTTSYRPGARFGCRAMRAESEGFETYSPYQDKDMDQIRVFDGGDLKLCIGDAATALGQIEEAAAQIAADKKIPVMLGGEHLVTLGTVRALVKQYPDLQVVHFDAHADLRDDYLGAVLSHAAVMRRIWEITGDGRIHQFGIRSGDKSEFLWGREHVRTRMFDFEGLAETADRLKGKPVYFTLDLDVLDPSVFPGTGTPEAGGVSFQELLRAVMTLSGLDIVGFDLVELSPPYDPSGISTAAACKLLREMLLAMLPVR